MNSRVEVAFHFEELDVKSNIDKEWRQKEVESELTKEKLIELYRQMVTIRLFEEAIEQVYMQALMPGLAHLYIGEEAVAVGACAALRPDDMITSTHRGHGHLIAKGGELDKMMAEVMGKAAGYCKGKGGSMHIADLGLGILGANGVVAGGLGIATGAGLSARMQGLDLVTLCFFGDGASNQGIFHETLNLASIWDLPVVYVCENNQYGISLSQSKSMNVHRVSDRAAAYGIPGVTTDGNDVLAVYRTVLEAVGLARQGKGPSLIECVTYRWRGHHVGDPGHEYRADEEVKAQKTRDCIALFRTWLIETGHLSSDQAEKIVADQEAAVQHAVEYAKDSPYPSLETVETDVYAD